MKKSVLLSAPLLAFTLACLPPASSSAHAGNQQGPAWDQAKAKNRQARNRPAAVQVEETPAPEKKKRWNPFRRKEKPAAAPADNGRADASLPPGGAANGAIPPADPPPGVDFAPPPPPAPAPAPSALNTPHERFVPSDELLEQAIRGNGPVDEEALILMAIRNSPRLARLRAEVAIAQARKKGAHAIPNPEVRIGYVTDRDTRIRRAYTERSTERIDVSERYRGLSSERNLAPEGLRGYGNYENEFESGTGRSTRYRTIERRVTPGRYTDRVETKIYESRRESGSSRTSVRGQDEFRPENAELAGNSRRDRELVERSLETIHHPDAYTRDDELSVLVRFDLPNPWELMARIQVAAAEIARAESEYLIEEDRVILEVRELYEELVRLESRRRARAANRQAQERNRSEVEALNDPELADLASDIRLRVSDIALDLLKLQSDISRVREELAVLCGLDDPSRIRLPDRVNRRQVNAGNLDKDYLTNLALLHRSDVLDLHARRQLAQAQLKQTNALKIPSLAFFDVGWANATTTRRRGENEEWQVRVAITLPLFDWIGINQTQKEFQTATELYERQIGDRQRLISMQIEQAINRIRRAEQKLALFETELKNLNASAERSLKETAEDLNDNARAKIKIEQLRSQYEEERYESWSEYNRSVLELERALGCRLEKALNGTVAASGD